MIELLKKHEGFSNKVYKCTENFLTIGYGRNLETNGITREEAEYLLKNDLKKIIKSLEHQDFFQNLNKNRKSVIVNMCYNLGLSGFSKFKKMIKALEIQDSQIS